jgi:DNA topoisomerase I
MTYKVIKTNCPECGSLIYMRYDSEGVDNAKGEIRCHMCNSIVISWVEGERKYSVDKLAKDKTDADFANYLSSLTVCPKCKGKLVERISIKGKFWGCENYPYCKYTGNSNIKKES